MIRVGALRALAGVLLLAGSTSGLADPPQRLGVASCAQSFCHGSARPLAATRVLQNEYMTWLSFDPHSRAYATLRSAKSQAMTARLGLGAATESKVCLDCHTDYVPRTQRGPKFQLDDGIGCEACHGSASSWIAPHHSGADRSHAANVARGLVALDQPRARAAVCTGCHVGDRSRFASHALMAAGHPRLSFELDTFTEIWRTSGGREHYRRDADYAQAAKSTTTGGRVWLRGLIEAATARLDLIDAQGGKQGLMPEFGVYNCYSCHRQMRVAAWAAAPSDGLAPGSLRFDDSAVRMLIAAFEGARRPIADELRRATREWQQSLNDAGRLKTAQQNLRRVLAAANGELDRLQFAPALSRAMLDALVAAARRGEFPDYASAEQAAMAMVLLLADSGGELKRRPDIDRLFQALRDDSQFDPRIFRERIAELK